MKSSSAFQTAIAHHQSGRLPQAIAMYRNLMVTDSRNPDLLHLLGLALHQTGKDEEAIPLFRRAIMLAPSAASYHANFAELWRKQGKTDEAIESYRQVLRLVPGDLEIRYLLGEALTKKGNFDEAIGELRRCISMGKGDSNTWACLCEALRRTERLDEAIDAAQRAVSLDRTSAAAWHSLGWTMMRQGKVREGLPYISEAIRLKPDWPLVVWRRAWGYLLLGDWASGFRDYESRWFDEELQLKTRRNLPGNVWHGEEIAGKAMYVHLEQGLGDFIHFVRYVPMILERGALAVRLETPPELVSLIRRSMPEAVELVTTPEQVVRYDLWTPILSLPLAFGTTQANVPAKVPYLAPDPIAVNAWRDRLAQTPGIKVGLVWAGSPSHGNDKNRSIPLKRLAPLAGIPGIRFVSVQKGEGAKQATGVPEMNLLDWTEGLKSFDDTAALLSALDLVIAVDTSVAHLSGALARPTWTLLPLSPDFRWMLDREDSPWYPTMRLFRQPTIGDWDTVVRRLGEELTKLVQHK
jgi:tetratricopeptide (TPR) repeat protein